MALGWFDRTSTARASPQYILHVPLFLNWKEEEEENDVCVKAACSCQVVYHHARLRSPLLPPSFFPFPSSSSSLSVPVFLSLHYFLPFSAKLSCFVCQSSSEMSFYWFDPMLYTTTAQTHSILFSLSVIIMMPSFARWQQTARPCQTYFTSHSANRR